MTAIHETSAVTELEGKGSRPVALFVGLDHEAGNVLEGLKQEFQASNAIYEPLVITEVAKQDGTFDQTLDQIETTLDRYVQSEIDLIQVCATPTNKGSLGNSSEFLDILFKIVVDAKPRLLLLDGLGINARVTIQNLIDEEPVGCCIVVDHIQGTKLARDLIADFYSLLLAGRPAKEAFGEVDARMKQRFNDVDKNLPWNISGSRTNARFGEPVIKIKKSSLLAKIFGQPEYPDKPPVALLIQAAGSQGDIAHSQEEIKDIKDALAASEHCQAEPIKNATVEIVRRRLRYFGKRIEIIHFAGHADGESILLKADDDEEIEPAYIAGLARDFNAVEPKLIFINGCSSEQQVAEFRDIPERAWSIMTDSEIDDECARRLAKEFYNNLANGNGIDAAFESARDRVEETLKDRFGRKAIEGAYRSAVHGEEKVVRQARYQFPWKLYPSSQKWRLGMTKLEEHVNDWKPGWQIEDVKWKPPFLNVRIPFGAIGLLAICLLAGFLSWYYLVRPPESLLTQPWVDAKNRDSIKIDLNELGSTTKSAEQLGAVLWPVNKIIAARNPDMHLILPESISDDVLAQLQNKELSTSNAPSRRLLAKIMTLVGFGALLFLIQALANFGCWHVRSGFKEAKQDYASNSARIFAQIRTFYNAVSQERQGTLIVFGCLVGLAPFLNLPISESFDRVNSAKENVNKITIQGNDKNFNMDSSLTKLTEKNFPELETIRIENAIIDSELIKQLSDVETGFEAVYEKHNLQADEKKFLTIDVDPKSNTFVTSFVNEEKVVREIRATNSQTAQKALQTKNELYDKLDEILDVEHGEDKDIRLKQFLVWNKGDQRLTIKTESWPTLIKWSKKRKERREQDSLRDTFDRLLMQLGRINTTIQLKTDQGGESSNLYDILQVLLSEASLKEASLANCLYGLDVSENVLASTSESEHGTGSRVSSIPAITGFRNLEYLNITGCKVDNQQLEELLLGKNSSDINLDGQANANTAAFAPLKKLRVLICNHNQFTQETLEQTVEWRVTDDETIDLQKLVELRSDAWAKPNPKIRIERIHEKLEEARSPDGLAEYGIFRINYAKDNKVEIKPTNVTVEDRRAIELLKYFHDVPELTLRFRINDRYSKSDAKLIKNKKMSVDKKLTIDNVNESREFLNDVFDDDSLIEDRPDRPGPKQLSLAKISTAMKGGKEEGEIWLDFSILEKSRISHLTIDGPLDILGIDGLTKPLESLVLHCANGRSPSRNQRILTLKPLDVRPKVSEIQITNAVLHSNELNELLNFKPEKLFLSDCEWDNVKRKEFDFDQFRRLFERSNENGDTEPITAEVYLPYVRCTDDPKLDMPILKFSDFEKIEYFRKLLDSGRVDEFLRRTRIFDGKSLHLIGTCSDIQSTVDILSDAKDLDNLNNIYVKLVSNNSDDPGASDSKEKRAATVNKIASALEYGNRGRRRFSMIQVKGESVGDELPENLKLNSKSYDFTGCPYVTPKGIYELGNIITDDAVVLVGGAMGIGDFEALQEKDPITDRLTGVRLDYSKGLITPEEQKELSRIRVFSDDSTWYTSKVIAYKAWTPKRHDQLWDLTIRIEQFLNSTETVDRGLVLAGAKTAPPGSNNPIKTEPTQFEQLKETQVVPGYWPLFLVAKAEIAEKRGDHAAADRFTAEALDLVDTIRKNFWSEELMVAGRQNYRNAFEARLKEYQEIKDSEITEDGLTIPQNGDSGETTNEN